jgi:hypothetical protein
MIADLVKMLTYMSTSAYINVYSAYINVNIAFICKQIVVISEGVLLFLPLSVKKLQFIYIISNMLTFILYVNKNVIAYT